MDNDDRQIGLVLSRREVLALLGTAGATLLVGCGPLQSGSGTTATAATSAPNAEAATAVAMQGNPTAAATAAAESATVVAANGNTVPACVVRPEVTEGP